MQNHQLSLQQAYQIAYDCLTKYGCDDANASALADTMTKAERDGCHAHGLFRLPGYIASLRSGKVNGKAKPTIKQLTPAVLQLNAHNGYAPYALQVGIEELVNTSKNTGIAALALIRVHHFSALWMEIEALTEQGLAALAFTAYKSTVAPAGGNQPFFGTNPIAFGWPRKNKPAMIFDQATAAMSRGDVMIAAREGRSLPEGVGINKSGQATTDPNEVLDGAMLTFGGYKGASIALMIELLVGPLLGEWTSPEASKKDNNDGGPPQGGELIIAIDPEKFGNGDNSYSSAETLFEQLLTQNGTRLPGQRRHKIRQTTERDGISIADSLMQTINQLKME